MEIIKAFSKFSITTELRKLLLANDDLKELVNNNIFPIVAPEDTVGNCIFYYRDKYKKEYTVNDFITNENVVVTFAVMSDDYDSTITIAELVNDILEGIHTNKDGYKYKCKMIESAEDLIDKKYFQVLQ